MGYKVKVSKRPVGRPALILDPLIDWNVGVGTELIKYMQSHDRIATADSINSFVVNIKNKPTRVVLDAAPSVKYALGGRRPDPAKPPPIIAIANWMDAKGIGAGLDPQSLNSFAWAIRGKIARDGTNPPKVGKGFITLVINRQGKKYLPVLADNIAKETSDSMIKLLTKPNNAKVKP